MIVKIEGCKPEEEEFIIESKHWVTARLIEAAKDLPVFDLPLAHIDISTYLYDNIKTAKDLAYHVKRCQETDFKYPVIMNDSGVIMNGWHRVAKALVEGRESIKAVRFEETPPHDYEETEDG